MDICELDKEKRSFTSPSEAKQTYLYELNSLETGSQTSPHETQQPLFSKRWVRRWWRVQTCTDIPQWKVGVLVFAGLTTVVFIVNLSILAWISHTYGFEDGIARLIDGDCQETATVNTWVHIAINVISSLLLGGSNYCMQTLVAPTRPEIDKAHSKQHTLDIGIPSLRNVWRTTNQKAYLWLLLAISSLPLHLAFNSIIFETIGTNGYDVILAYEEFLEGDPHGSYEGIHALDNSIQAQAKDWDRLSPLECIDEYANVYINTRRNLVAVLSNTTERTTNGSVDRVISYNFNPTDDHFYWICNAYDGIERYGYTELENVDFSEVRCDNKIDKVRANVANWTIAGKRVEYCMSEQVSSRCTLGFSYIIGIMVIICNVCKFVVMIAVAVSVKDRPVVTVGDAIESFLIEPDKVTAGLSLYGKYEIGERWASRKILTPATMLQSLLGLERIRYKVVSFKATSERLLTSVGKFRWRFILFIISLCIVITSSLLVYAVVWIYVYSKFAGSPTNLLSLGLGKVRPRLLISSISNFDQNTNFALLRNVLLANVPHLILSLIYFVINGVCTTMVLSLEWDAFAHSRKPLRVSYPKPGQQSTYFLELPYRYSVPLLIVSMLLHWLVSESIFLAKISKYNKKGELIDENVVSTCGYSPLGILLTITFAAVVLAAILLMGFRRLRPGIPVAGSCSAAISAACHPCRLVSDESNDVHSADLVEDEHDCHCYHLDHDSGHEKGCRYYHDNRNRNRVHHPWRVDTTAPLRWGVTCEAEAAAAHPGRCAFSDLEVTWPFEGKKYA